MNGVVRDSSSNRLSGRSMPTRPAMAARCTMAFVEPPTACRVRMAFSKAAGVRMSEGRRPCSTSCTICRPAASDNCWRRESTAGMAALPGSAIPSASLMAAMVEAVPITMQCPGLRTMQLCNSAQSSSVIRSARSSW